MYLISLADGVFSVEAKSNSQSGFGIFLCGMKVPALICHLGDYVAYSSVI